MNNNSQPETSMAWRFLVQLVPILALFTAGYLAHAPNRGLPITPMWALIAVLLADGLRRERLSSNGATPPARASVARALLLPQAAGLALWGVGLVVGWLVHGATDVWLALTGALLTLCAWTASFIAAQRGRLVLATWLGVALVATIGVSVVAPCVAHNCSGLGTIDAQLLGDLRIPVACLGVAASALTGLALRQ